jgi:hypothetical protein
MKRERVGREMQRDIERGSRQQSTPTRQAAHTDVHTQKYIYLFRMDKRKKSSKESLNNCKKKD